MASEKSYCKQDFLWRRKKSVKLWLPQFLVWNAWAYSDYCSWVVLPLEFFSLLYCFLSPPPSYPNSKGIKVVLVFLLLKLLHFSARWLSLKCFCSRCFRCCLSSIVPLLQSIFLPVTSVLFILIPIQTFLFLSICLQTPYLTKKLFLGKSLSPLLASFDSQWIWYDCIGRMNKRGVCQIQVVFFVFSLLLELLFFNGKSYIAYQAI